MWASIRLGHALRAAVHASAACELHDLARRKAVRSVAGRDARSLVNAAESMVGMPNAGRLVGSRGGCGEALLLVVAGECARPVALVRSQGSEQVRDVLRGSDCRAAGFDAAIKEAQAMAGQLRAKGKP